MAYTGTLTTEAEIAIFAGELVDATGNTEANHNLLVAQAEAFICLLGKKDFVAAYGSLDTVTKKILNEYCARYAATALIAYNTAGYTNGLTEAEDIMTLHLARMKKIEGMIEDQTFVNLVVAL